MRGARWIGVRYCYLYAIAVAQEHVHSRGGACEGSTTKYGYRAVWVWMNGGEESRVHSVYGGRDSQMPVGLVWPGVGSCGRGGDA